MTPNQMLTAGAVAFAAFAVIYLQRQSGASTAAAVSPQPAQRDRDSGMAAWNGLQLAQAGQFYTPAPRLASFDLGASFAQFAK